MKKTSPAIYIMFVFLVLFVSCIKAENAVKPKSDSTVGIMTFNTENLFDVKHDDAKLDYTFLPLSEKKTAAVKEYCKNLGSPKWKEECLGLDWSNQTLKMKMANLADTVLQVQGGKGPDILVLQEVENKAVLQELVEGPLQKAGYTTVVLIEGKDARGIDVAIVSRLPKVGQPELHEIPFRQISKKELPDTRGILEVELELSDQKKLTVYAAHFPAPFHKREYRSQAFEYLNSLMEKKSADALQIAAGDFNTTSKENRKYQVLKTHVEPAWIIAHQVAYQGQLGSSYYPRDKTWSFLDMILLSKNFNDKSDWEWDSGTFQIADKMQSQLTDEGFPQSFDPRTGQGVSDHLPLYLEIRKK